jgi:CubicO group peptidase (beta-lactamase class C family)
MSDTGIALSSSMKQRVATGHNAMLTPVANWDFLTLASAGALRSSANDLLTLLEAFLGYRESPLAPAMKAMFEVRRRHGQTEIGLGWMISSVHDREIAAHDGGTGGFRAWVGYDPKERLGVVVLSNAATPIGVFDIGIHLLDPKWPIANLEAPKERTEVAIDPRLLDHYTGRYQVMPNLILEITRDGHRLFAQAFVQTNKGPRFEVFAESENKFFAKVSDKQIAFDTGPDGRATSLILYGSGRQPMPAVRVP